jgi:hypothetical protein
MGFPGLSAAGIRFSILPSPTGDLDLPHGRFTTILLGGPHRGLHVPHEGGVLGVGASCTPGPSVFMPGYGRDPGPSAIQLIIASTRFSVISHNDASTEIHFCVHPSELRLARFARLVWAPLGLLRRLRTSSLPNSHAPDDDGIEHYPESILDYSSQATSCRNYLPRWYRRWPPLRHFSPNASSGTLGCCS